MKVFVYEHLCGGGLAGQPLPAELVDQGMAMFTAAVDDFIKLGAQVAVTLDRRLTEPFNRPSVRVVTAAGPIEEAFADLAAWADATLVIAPEFNHILEKFAQQLGRQGARSLGCTSEAVRLCADKLALAEHFMQAGIPTPPTARYDPTAAPPHGTPAIIKPRHGVGCEQTFLCEKPGVCPLFAQQNRGLTPSRRFFHRPQQFEAEGEFIIQPCIPGRPVSVSLMIHDHAVTSLLVGEQLIVGHDAHPTKLQYEGGQLPLTGDVADRALSLATAAAATIVGLGGFIGLDLLLGQNHADDVVIEINPRLTVSYVALRQVCNSNLAAAMLDPHPPLQWSDRSVQFDTTGKVVPAQVST